MHARLYSKAIEKVQAYAPRKLQYSPYPTAPRKYGLASQEPMPGDTAPPATKDEITHIQQIVKGILYNYRSLDFTVLVDLSIIASEQVKETTKVLKNVNQVLYYLAKNPYETIRFHVSDIILNIHLDSYYLSAKSLKSRTSGNFFLGYIPKDGEPITINVAILTLCTIMKFVASSSAETELSALFMNLKEGCTIPMNLAELSHPQTRTPIHYEKLTNQELPMASSKNNAPAP